MRAVAASFTVAVSTMLLGLCDFQQSIVVLDTVTYGFEYIFFPILNQSLPKISAFYNFNYI